MEILPLVIIFVFGLCIGSFLNVVILRLPQEESLAGRSHCPNCKRLLSFLELLPVVSFLGLGAKCRTCGKKISWRYPLIEVLVAGLFVLFWVTISPGNLVEYLLLFQSLVLIGFLVAVFVIDLERYIILDRLVFPAAILFFFINLIRDGVSHQYLTASFSGIIGAFAGVLPFFLIWYFSKGRLMGFGDVKLMLPLGLVAGWPGILITFLIGVFSGSFVGLLLLILGKKTLKSALPFGCFLSFGALIAQIYAKPILSWYLSLLGL
ncbi:MAG: prepilin peptidase [Candidatus Doudnabacteria bacterium]|nr:prepilin peptidase [Candidatus Doudnabacteria bacterium]